MWDVGFQTQMVCLQSLCSAQGVVTQQGRAAVRVSGTSHPTLVQASLSRILPSGLFMLQPHPGQSRSPWLIQSSRRALGSQEQGSSPGSQTPAPTPITYVIWEKMLNKALCSLFPLPRILFSRICMWLFCSFTLITSQLRCHLLSEASLAHLI